MTVNVIPFVCYLLGFAGMLFVAFLIIHERFCKQCIVHYVRKNGVRGYTTIKACTKSGASRMVSKYNPEVKEVTKVTKVVMAR